MEWRCTWCGKPHAENDPPCDNCGHNAFERAIVRAEADESAGSSSGTVDTGTTYVWSCSDCGRDHVKHNPPCSRCGNPILEKTEQTYDDVDRDLATPSWLEAAKPYTPILGVVALVVALFATGIVSPSILPEVGEPTPPDAPGDGAEAAGIDLEETETEIHDRLEEDREESRTYDEGLAAYAEYHNRAYVAIQYDDAKVEQVSLSDFGVDCRGELDEGQLPYALSLENYDDESELADGVVEVIRLSDSVTGTGFDAEGMDLHVVNGAVYVFYGAC